MRVRVDILLVVVFLATRVHNTNNSDIEKLRRLLGYLKKYPDRYMVFFKSRRPRIVSYCDATQTLRMQYMKMAESLKRVYL